MNRRNSITNQLKTEDKIFIKSIKNWLNVGTKTEIIIKKLLLNGLTGLLVYRLGYAIGSFLAHIV